jgi:hypothetical protein
MYRLSMLLILLAGCATPYGPKSLMGGYTDFTVSADTFGVTVDGNAYTDRATLMQHFHRRARELCDGEYEFKTDIATDSQLVLTKSYMGNVDRHSITGYVTCKVPPGEASTQARRARELRGREGKHYTPEPPPGGDDEE